MLRVIVLLKDPVPRMCAILSKGPYKGFRKYLDKEVLIHSSGDLMKFSNTSRCNAPLHYNALSTKFESFYGKSRVICLSTFPPHNVPAIRAVEVEFGLI